MKTLRIIALLVFGLAAAQSSMGQSRETREETPLGEKSDPLKGVQLFPNPAIDYLTLKFELPQARKTKLAMSTIIGSNLEVESEVIDDFEVRIKVVNLPPGYYLLAMHNGETNSGSTYKFLKR